MRLLRLEDDDTLSPVEYFGKNVPPYAILSHTWGPDHEELTFRDLVDGTGKDRNGYRKLVFCGKQAAKDNLKFFWVDTVCIDRTSSAELQEALNSMFRWYQTAVRCYVYLSDVSTQDITDNLQPFHRSRWFTRGWTLQELIAPASVEFFSVDCDRIGDKISMIEDIHTITEIPVEVLQGSPLSSFSTDERMSWAKGRNTKREEDAAYSLLGIFDVYMPLIYGEGRENAVARLERKISKYGANYSAGSTPSKTQLGQPRQSLGPLPFLFNDQPMGLIGNFNGLSIEDATKTHPSEISGEIESDINNRQPQGQSLVDALKELFVQTQGNDTKPRHRDGTRANDEAVDDTRILTKENNKNENVPSGAMLLEHEHLGNSRRKTKPSGQISTSIKASSLSLQWTEVEAFMNDERIRDQIQRASIQEVLQLLLNLRDQARLKTQNTVNDWLDVTKFNEQYNVAQYYDKQLTSRLDNTCEWIFSHADYCTWVSEEPQGIAKILWVHAPAGHGKSVLCARVVEHLKGIQPAFVAYFFASPHAQSGGMPDFIVRSWVAQMTQLDPDVLNWAKQNSKSGQRASDSAIWTIFEQIVSLGRNYVFVLDGFDEYSRSDNARSRFLQKLKKAIDRTASRILITSRSETDIESELSQEPADDSGIIILRCRITHEDVGHDISLFSKSLVDEKLPKKDDRLRQELAGQLAQKCEGMFLWIKMQQDQLRGGKNKKQLQNIVNNMPAGLMKTYERNWNTIRDKPVEEQIRALTILKWATFGLRPLSVLEATEALIVDYKEGVVTLRSDDLPDDIDEEYINGEIVDICAGLVEVRAEDNVEHNSAKTIHLIHASVRDFLLSGQFSRPMDISRSDLILDQTLNHAEQHVDLAIACLGYLCNPEIWEQHTGCESSGHIHDFTCYAANYWSMHVSAGGQDNTELLHLMEVFFRIDNPAFGNWSRYIGQLESMKEEDEEEKDEFCGITATPLYYAALFNLPALMEQIWAYDKTQLNQLGGTYGTPLQAACFKGHMLAFELLIKWGADPNIQGGKFGAAINAAIAGGHRHMVETLMGLELNYALQDPMGRTPLYTAAKQGDQETVFRLLEAGAEPATTNKYGWTPLNLAADDGNFELVKMLLDRGGDMSVANHGGNTPLHSAAKEGHLEIVKLLLEKGADVNTSNNHKWTPLNLAAEDGYFELVKMLLDRGGDITIATINGNTPLHSAAKSGHLDVVKLLLEKGADVNAPNETQWTPLNAAADCGHLEVVKLLLEKDADMEAGNDRGWTPLNSASVKGNNKIAQVLLENGANIEATNIYGDNALNLAAYSGQLEFVKLMLEKGATMVADNDGLTPLNSAAERGHVNVARVLLEHHADMVADNEGWTPLCSAAINGYLEIVKLLLEHGADMAATTFGWTPLNTAARQGHLETVKLLFEYGADMAASSDGSTPLNAAAERGHLEVVKLLLEKGADMAADNDGWTPLNSAAGNGHHEVVKLLLEKGADMAADNDGWTPLTSAAGDGHHEVVKLLLEKGANSTTANKNGWTALTAAADQGHLEVVQTLLEVTDDFDTVPSPLGSLLHIFAYKGYTDLLRFVHQERHVDLGLVSHLGHNCFQLAARKGHVETLQYLLSLNLVCPEDDAKGDGLLSYASSGGSIEIIKTLLNKIPEVPFTSRHWTPLHWACRASSPEVVELLIEAGFRSQCVALSQPEGQWSPLSVAIYHGNQAMLEKLSEQSRSLIGAKDEDVQVQGKLHEDLQGEKHGTYWCSGCFHDIYGQRFHCENCTNLDYCFMCKPFLGSLHVGHEWSISEPPAE